MAVLKIWGAIEELPSIDAECIATLAYIAHIVKSDESVAIVSSYDASESTNGDFPVLESRGETYAGFAVIAQHLNGSSDVPQSQADIEAWSAFIRSRGQALLDLYFYVSSTNYWNAISPAWTRVLPFYANYTIPPAKRAAAISRTKHLGIRSLDLDSIDEYAAGDDVRIAGQPTQPASFANTTNPDEIIKKQQSARWLRSQQHSDTFQLFQLTKAFFEPLEEVIGDKEYFLGGDEPTTLDCVAYGYLALMKYSPMPQPWLKDALEKRFPKLNAYTERMHDETMKKLRQTQILQQAQPTAVESALAIGRSILNWVAPFATETIKLDPTVQREDFEQQHETKSSLMLSRILSPAILLPLGIVAGAALGIVKFITITDEDSMRSNAITFQAHEQDFLQQTRLSDLGESGAMLSAAFGGVAYPESQVERERERTGGAPMVEVDVDVANEKGEVERDIVYKK